MQRHLVLAAAAAAFLAGYVQAEVAPSSVLTGSRPLSDHILRSGATTTQGDAAMNAPQARSTYGVSGSTIKIGVISDSFAANAAGYAAGIASSDLPTVNIVKDSFGSDEGRAMAEIVHDIAPGAQIMFHSAFNNQTSTAKGVTVANAIDALVAAGANVIVDDVGLFTQPIYQHDKAAQAITNARNAGVAYFTAAGNSGSEATSGAFTGSTFHDFNNGSGTVDNVLQVQVPANSTATFTLHWAEPYATLGGTPSSKLNLLFYDGTNLFDFGDDPNGDPVNVIALTNPTASAANGLLAIHGESGSFAGKKFRITAFRGSINDPTQDTNSSSIIGHQLTDAGIVVGAHFYPTSTPESFTGTGPGHLLFDPDGNPIDQLINVPSLIAPDGVNTTFFGQAGVNDGDAFPNFFGTSAAAPHAAAVAALMLERAMQLNITLTPDELYYLMQSTAIDVGAPGYDYITGWGRLDAFAAIAAVPEPAMAFALVAAPMVLLRRRRRAA